MEANLWTDKFRPKTVNEFYIPEYLKKFLNSSIDTPHLLLYGPPGSGKTTFAKILTRNNHTLFFNASDERGIDFIRNTVKKQAQYVQKKFIVLDECENLTKDSQTCLRRILEDYNTTTFIFITNYYSKIIDPIKSRTLKLKFNFAYNQQFIENIAQQVSMDPSIIEEVYKYSDKDLRKTLNILQGIKYTNNNNNTSNLIKYYCGIIPENLMVTHNSATINTLKANNYSVIQYIKQLVMQNSDPKIAVKLGELEKLSINGCSDELIYDLINYLFYCVLII